MPDYVTLLAGDCFRCQTVMCISLSELCLGLLMLPTMRGDSLGLMYWLKPREDYVEGLAVDC